MRFGLIVQMTGLLGYPQSLVRLAREAEAAGEAGTTWWVEGIGEWRGDIDAMAAFIQGGPPGK